MSEEEDIMNVYADTSAKVYIPTPEDDFNTGIKESSENVMDYFTPSKPSKSPQPPQPPQAVQPQQTAQPYQRDHPQLLTEAQQRDTLLTEAATSLSKVMQMFPAKEDKTYLKQIREAIEEMMG